MYWLRKRLWSQNSFTNRELIEKLIRGSSIEKNDLVLDIGSGNGIISRELSKITPRVISIEKDPKLTDNPQDFLNYKLPTGPYKVFANIPFSITGDIVRKLLSAKNPPSDCYLVMQKEAADKYLINRTNTMAAMLYYPWWSFKVIYKFCRRDFSPPPKVDSVLLRITPRQVPLLNKAKQLAYWNFVAHHYVYNPKAKFVKASQWLMKFGRSKLNASGTCRRLLEQQNRLIKIHRTRTDKKWKMYNK